MANYTFQQITAGKTAAQVFADLLALLQNLPSGLSLPTAYWGGGDPIPVILQWGLSPLLSTLYTYAAKIAQGGALRLALKLAKADLPTWNTDPALTFLGWLATERWSLTIRPPSFTVGTWRVTNAWGPVTLPATFTVQDNATGLQATLVGGPVTVPSGVSFITIQATQPGPQYNLPAGSYAKLVTTVAGITGSVQPQSPATNWIIDFGGNRESPDSVVTRCLGNWGRLAKGQTLVQQAYIALALDSDITGTKVPTKAQAWINYSAALPGIRPNYITIWLGGDAGPVDAGTAATVLAGIAPYAGICDTVECQPCLTATWNPTITAYVAGQQDLVPAAQAIYANLNALQTAVPIGGFKGLVRASDIRQAVLSVPQVAYEEDVLTDFAVAQNVLLTLGTGGISVQVQP